ncbi:hypothetical protein KSS87_015470 [Heliosperma pusillum]|nr:hypothetical protein KSS87_015470 [Heliosperma pusillum]
MIVDDNYFLTCLIYSLDLKTIFYGSLPFLVLRK